MLTARPGFEITGHQLTGRRSIVATVHTKQPVAGLPRGEALLDSIGGVPVDVREANAYQRLRANDPLAAEISQTYRRPEDAEPEWPLERELPSGQLLTSARSETQKKLAAQRKAQPASDRALIAHQHKPKLDYVPAGCPPLFPELMNELDAIKAKGVIALDGLMIRRDHAQRRSKVPLPWMTDRGDLRYFRAEEDYPRRRSPGRAIVHVIPTRRLY